MEHTENSNPPPPLRTKKTKQTVASGNLYNSTLMHKPRRVDSVRKMSGGLKFKLFICIVGCSILWAATLAPLLPSKEGAPDWLFEISELFNSLTVPDMQSVKENLSGTVDSLKQVDWKGEIDDLKHETRDIIEGPRPVDMLDNQHDENEFVEPEDELRPLIEEVKGDF